MYSANASGSYLKRWRAPAPGRTQLASKSRGILGINGAPWRALSQLQRDAWTSYAALPAQTLYDSLGNPYFASGWNWYCTLNSRLMWLERDTIPDPPSDPNPAQPTINSIALFPSGSPNLSAITYPLGEFDGVDLLVFAHLAYSHGAVSFSASLKMILATTIPGPYSTNFQFGLERAFGAIPESARLFCSVQRQDTTGQRSPAALIYGDD